MDSMIAYRMALANQDREPMVFDWEEAARRIVAAGATSASAGLRDDWEWTGGEILKDGVPVALEDSGTYLCSVHAVPEIAIDGGPRSPCFRLENQSHGWDADTFWPAEALAILNERKGNT